MPPPANGREEVAAWVAQRAGRDHVRLPCRPVGRRAPRCPRRFHVRTRGDRRGDARLRHGNRQGRCPFRRSLQHARQLGSLLSRSGPGRTRWPGVRVPAALLARRSLPSRVLHRECESLARSRRAGLRLSPRSIRKTRSNLRSRRSRTCCDCRSRPMESRCEKLLEKSGVLERLEAAENMAAVRIKGNLATLVDLLPSQAKVKRRVMRQVERFVGDQRDAWVYFPPRELAAHAEMEWPALARTLRELAELSAFDYVPAFRGRAIHMPDRSRPFDSLEIDFEHSDRRKQAEYERLDTVLRYCQTRILSAGSDPAIFWRNRPRRLSALRQLRRDRRPRPPHRCRRIRPGCSTRCGSCSAASLVPADDAANNYWPKCSAARIRKKWSAWASTS